MRIRSNLGRRIGAWAIVGAASLFGIAACGSSGPMPSGESVKSANHIFRDAQTATGGATSARVSGQVTSSGRQTTLDVVAGQGKGGGTVGTSGASLQLVLAQPNVYIKADQASWQTLTSNSALASLLANKWLQTTTANSDFADIANLLDLSKLTASLKPTGTLTKGPTATFSGKSAIPLADSGNGGTLYVANEGTPYILGLTGSGSNSGTLKFGQYDSASIPSPPSGAVSLSQLENQSSS
jgi:hypothetical protein